jgi:hypothetical protein
LEKLLAILLLISLRGEAPDYPLKDGKPTGRGIEQYIEERGNSILKEYQQFVGDTVYNVWIYTASLKEFGDYDSLELGRYFQNEVYINKDGSFEAYELDDLTPLQKNSIPECNRFVKSVVIHELTHEYISQIGTEMRFVDHIGVHRTYQTGLSIVISHENFGSLFIEEGICEYMAEKMGELIPPKKRFIPKTIEEITSKDNLYLVKYKYSSAYVKPFLDTTGLKEGIKILLHNPPPSYEEILNPGLFYSRLLKIDE